MTLLDLAHSIALVAGLGLLWFGCTAYSAPLAPIVVGSLLILGVAYARKGSRQ